MSLGKSRIAVVVAVSDMNRARGFYEGQLGLELAEASTVEELSYECGEATELVVYLSPENAGSATATVAAWQVDDLDLEMDVLISRGIEFEHYDQPGPITDRRGVAELHGSRVAWFRDPDGNTFAISQEFPSSRPKSPSRLTPL